MGAAFLEEFLSCPLSVVRCWLSRVRSQWSVVRRQCVFFASIRVIHGLNADFDEFVKNRTVFSRVLG